MIGLVIVRKNVDELRQDPSNARKHGERNLNAIRASLSRWGQRVPLVVRPDGTVVGGNATLACMRGLGMSEVDVVVFEGSDAEAAALALNLNRSAELAGWDEEVLARTLAGLDRELALAAGWLEAELTKFGNLHAAGSMDAPAPPAPLVAASKEGDLWIIGNHRLLCGDSASAEDVDRLLAGAPIHLCNTDPPYNVRVEPRSNNAIAAGLSSFGNVDDARRAGQLKSNQQFDVMRHGVHDGQQMRAKDRPLENDFVSDEEFARMLRAWFGNIARVLLPGRALYCWGGYSNIGNYPSALAECGLYFSQAIIWVKEHPVLTRKDFMGNHEWCFYCWREGAAHQWFGPTNASDTWIVKKVNPQSMVHLTEKPVELAVRAIEYSSKPGENVLDLFGGSGSTLMAAEQTGRRAFLVEIDCAYCDVIVERWQAATGRQATLDADGRTFDAVRAERLVPAPAAS